MSDAPMPPKPNDASARWVVCLCADWCGTCRDYRPVFERVAADHPGWKFFWLDIEDEAEVVGDLEVETFPMLLISDAGQLRFCGPLLPHATTLSRLITAMDENHTAATGADPALQLLVQGIHRRISSGNWTPL
jgi:thioredoxin 1